MNHGDVPDHLRATEVLLTGLDATLAKRAATHGSFEENAALTQQLVSVFRRGHACPALTDAQVEALHMIAIKLARIVNGNPDHADSWHDIAGYATLIENVLTKETK